MHTVVETPEYLRQRIPEAERNAIADYLARNPTAGELIPGTGGARKVRFAMKGRGKSGGYRVITYFGGVEIPLFILTAYKKGERANLSAAQRNALRKVLSALTREYRQGVKQSAKKSRR
ncbi:MAG: type II toxin-antitoxin system RelE/ParE family toxin [Proteobacteria bacterium]|nr:type II toxin-antitoxin system RelE/ParE family toxin [Pseudomonadota bacterium]